MKNLYKTLIKGFLITSMLASPLMLIAGEAERKAANELLDATQFEKQMDNAINMSVQIVEQMNPSMKEHEPEIREFYEKYIGSDSIRNDVVTIYAETFTLEELEYMTSFYKTKTGQKALEKMPELMQRSMQMGQSRIMENMGELEEIMKKKNEAK